MIKKIKILSPFIILIMLFLMPGFSKGAGLVELSDNLSKLKQNSLSDHNIKFKTNSGASLASSNIVISFPAGFDIGTITFADIDLSHGLISGLETSESLNNIPTNTDWGASFTGQTLTLTHPTDPLVGTIGANEYVVINIGTNASGGVNQIKNGPAGNYNLQISGTFGDSGQIPIVIVADDQIASDGDVVESISLVLSSHSTSFGLVNLGAIAASTPNITLTISTNHASGYSLAIQDSGDGTHPGLYKTADQIVPAQLIGSADPNYSNSVDLNSVITGYGIQAVCLSGCDTDTEIVEKYRKTTDTTVAGLKTTADLLMEYHAYLTTDHVVEIRHVVKASQYARTGNYIDHITYIATPNF